MQPEEKINVNRSGCPGDCGVCGGAEQYFNLQIMEHDGKLSVAGIFTNSANSPCLSVDSQVTIAGLDILNMIRIRAGLLLGPSVEHFRILQEFQNSRASRLVCPSPAVRISQALIDRYFHKLSENDGLISFI